MVCFENVSSVLSAVLLIMRIRIKREKCLCVTRNYDPDAEKLCKFRKQHFLGRTVLVFWISDVDFLWKIWPEEQHL